MRPATEAEILAEAVKHGWKESKEYDFMICGPLDLIRISGRYGYALCDSTNKPTTENLKEYGKECIEAHRLITALNLAK